MKKYINSPMEQTAFLVNYSTSFYDQKYGKKAYDETVEEIFQYKTQINDLIYQIPSDNKQLAKIMQEYCDDERDHLYAKEMYFHKKVNEKYAFEYYKDLIDWNKERILLQKITEVQLLTLKLNLFVKKEERSYFLNRMKDSLNFIGIFCIGACIFLLLLWGLQIVY